MTHVANGTNYYCGVASAKLQIGNTLQKGGEVAKNPSIEIGKLDCEASNVVSLGISRQIETIQSNHKLKPFDQDISSLKVDSPAWTRVLSSILGPCRRLYGLTNATTNKRYLTANSQTRYRRQPGKTRKIKCWSYSIWKRNRGESLNQAWISCETSIVYWTDTSLVRGITRAILASFLEPIMDLKRLSRARRQIE